MELTYSEIFYSIQGEGTLMGTPSVFFRTSGCNLRCTWCDTPFTSFDPENKKISIEDVVDKILSFDCSHIVITGGEPFAQPLKLQVLCTLLKSHQRHITIETNGTIYEPVQADLISLSPKLSNSTPTPEQVKGRWIEKHETDRLNGVSLKAFMGGHGESDYQFKFVVSTDQDVDEIEEIQERLDIPDHKIYLMPEGIISKSIEEKQEWVAEVCLAKKWRYSDRLHVRIWQDRRGV